MESIKIGEERFDIYETFSDMYAFDGDKIIEAVKELTENSNEILNTDANSSPKKMLELAFTNGLISGETSLKIVSALITKDEPKKWNYEKKYKYVKVYAKEKDITKIITFFLDKKMITQVMDVVKERTQSLTKQKEKKRK